MATTKSTKKVKKTVTAKKTRTPKKATTTIFRCWIDSPSTLQPYRKFHATNGICVKRENSCTFFFLEGDTISMEIDPKYLQKGWLKRK